MTDAHSQVAAFLEKHRVAKISNSREIRLTMHDADLLSASIAVLLAQQATLSQKIMDLQQQIISAEIKQDGGRF